MKRGRAQLLVTCGALTILGCTAEVDGTVASLSQATQATQDQATQETPADTGTVVIDEAGAAGSGAAEPAAPASMRPMRDGVIYGVGASELSGFVKRAAGTTLSGTIELACCRAGSYQVYTYRGGRCADPETWTIETSARIAQLACAGDLGEAPYVRDPSPGEALAVVIYDAAGTAVGCAELDAD